VRAWAPQIDAALRESAGQRNPSEWYKKEECWKEMQAVLPQLSDPLPSELSYLRTDHVDAIAPVGTHSVADYERIARCMKVNATTWLEAAERGQQAGIIHWRVAGICRTMASYAAGGWERKPSIKQAKHGLDAVLAVERAGLVHTGLEQMTAGEPG
jgi:hypothetical protein